MFQFLLSVIKQMQRESLTSFRLCFTIMPVSLLINYSLNDMSIMMVHYKGSVLVGCEFWGGAFFH